MVAETPPAAPEAPRPGLSAQALAALPAVAALFLGALYAIGALLKMADLRGEGLRVWDTLPLVPLPELLSRGIGTAVVLSAGLAALVAYGACIHGYWRAPANSSLEGAYGVGIGLLLGAAAIVAVLFPPWIVGLGVLAAMSISAGVDAYLKENGIWPAYAVLVIALLVNAVVSPTTLPKVQVATTGHGVVAGRMVTVSNGDWYVAANHMVRVVAHDQVVSARIASSPQRSQHRPLARVAPEAAYPVGGILVLIALIVMAMSASDFVKYRKQEKAAKAADNG